MLMVTWMKGREALLAERWREAMPLETFLATLQARPAAARAGNGRVHGARTTASCRPALLHNLKHNKVLHDRVVLMKVVTEGHSRACPTTSGSRCAHLDHNFHTVAVHYGFMDEPNIRARWRSCG